VDVVPRAIIETRVEQGSPVTTACLIRIGVFLDPSTTLLIRLFAGLLISHNVILSLLVFSATSFRVAAGRQLCRFTAGEASPKHLEIFVA
jgi:hypothetical protein